MVTPDSQDVPTIDGPGEVTGMQQGSHATEVNVANNSLASSGNIDVAMKQENTINSRSDPQLIGDIGGEVYGVIHSGSIIVRVNVDANGTPSSLTRLFCDVPLTVAKIVEQRILSSRFRPAEQDGVAVGGTLEISVTIGASQNLRTLDAS